jgi:hypothetical protein
MDINTAGKNHVLACWLGVLLMSSVVPGASGTDKPLPAASAAAATGALPEGNRGIAAGHPGDRDIAKNAAVLLAEDFEDCRQPADLRAKWATVHHEAHMRMATEPGKVMAGAQSLEFTVPRQELEFSHALAANLKQEQKVLFLRYYSKFDPPFDVTGSSHNGSTISGKYFVDGRATPGEPADGRNKFLVALEHWRGEASIRSPGQLNLYVYHPEQRSQWGDHFLPSGQVLPNSSLAFDFGPRFVSRPDVVPELGRWHCYELMVSLNTPGQRDGRLAFWLDGRLQGDFGNLRLRDIDSLQIDRFGLNFHIGSNPNGPSRQWFDNVVAATSYIGPMVAPADEAKRPDDSPAKIRKAP